MAYFIYDIRTAKPQSGFCYLVDTNIWLAVLEPTFNKSEYKSYLNFFNNIISNTVVQDAVIGIPCLLIAEILRRIINDIYYEEFILTHTPYPHESKRQHFKRVYRPSSEYTRDVEIVCATIRGYHSKIKFISDRLDEYSCKNLIKNIPSHLDINDYLYSKIALQQGINIVTNDADFRVEDIHIYTTQQPLLQLMQQ